MKVWPALQAFLAVFWPSITLAQFCQKFVDCPADSCSFPEHGIDFYTVTLAWLSEQEGPGVAEFDQNFDAAVALLKSLGDVSTDDDMIKHMTVQYLCCYSPDQYARIIDVLGKVSWEPVPLTFSQVICNPNDNINSSVAGQDVSFVVVADQQAELAALVASFEAALEADGIPVPWPRAGMTASVNFFLLSYREEPFHTTLGVVDPDYPIAEALQQLTQQIPTFNSQPIVLDHYDLLFPPWIFYANQSSNTTS